MTPVLDARGVGLDGRLKPTDLSLQPSELVALIGPNGSGKTSLLRSLADIERTSGEVLLANRPIGALALAQRPYAFTFLPASRDLCWPISTRDVIALGLPRPEPQRVEELIELLELSPFADRAADRLSTGERARVLLARALAPRPKLLLLDEPLSNLDPYWVLRLLQILRETVSNGTAALVSLHDIDRVLEFDRAILMSGGEIRLDGRPEALLASEELSHAFGIHRTGDRWEIRPLAAPRSSR